MGMLTVFITPIMSWSGRLSRRVAGAAWTRNVVAL